MIAINQHPIQWTCCETKSSANKTNESKVVYDIETKIRYEEIMQKFRKHRESITNNKTKNQISISDISAVVTLIEVCPIQTRIDLRLIEDTCWIIEAFWNQNNKN